MINPYLIESDVFSLYSLHRKDYIFDEKDFWYFEGSVWLQSLSCLSRLLVCCVF